MSSDDPLLARGGSSMEKERVDIAARSRKKAFVLFTYMADCCDPVGKYIHVHVTHGVNMVSILNTYQTGRDQP